MTNADNREVFMKYAENMTCEQYTAWKELYDSLVEDGADLSTFPTQTWADAYKECSSFDEFGEVGYGANGRPVYDFCNATPKRI